MNVNAYDCSPVSSLLQTGGDRYVYVVYSTRKGTCCLVFKIEWLRGPPINRLGSMMEAIGLNRKSS